MQLVSNLDIKQVLDILSDTEFSLYSKLESMEITGDIIPYEPILGYIKSVDCDNRETIKNNIVRYMKDNESNMDNNLARIMNYALLEIPRADEFDKMEHNSKQAHENLSELRNKLRDFEKDKKRHEEKIEKIQGDFISILSIFSAVIIAFFGGLNIVASALANMHNVSIYRLMFILLTLGLIMFNVIYMLLNEVSKLTNKSINRGINKCSKCKNIQHLKCCITKHTSAFYYNVICSSGLFIVCLAYIVDKYNIITYILNTIKYLTGISILSDRELVPVVGIICIILIYIASRKQIIKFIEDNTCNNTSHENNSIGNLFERVGSIFSSEF